MTHGFENLDRQAMSRSDVSPADQTLADGLETDDSDDALVLRYRQGDSGAFELLYERHKGPIYRFFLRQLAPAQANDGFQETWTKLISNVDKFEPRGAFQAYLFKLAHNVLMDYHRLAMRSGISDNAPSDIVEEESDVAGKVSDMQLRTLLHAEIARLPLNQRTVWLIKQETQMNLSEIAELTGATLEGVKSRLRYANEKLKAGMQRYVRA